MAIRASVLVRRRLMEASKRSFSSHGRLVLVRHGQSLWNVTSKEKCTTERFTGWANVGLSEKGRLGAIQAGRSLHYSGVKVDAGVTSLLDRAQETLSIILDELEQGDCHHDTPTTSCRGASTSTIGTSSTDNPQTTNTTTPTPLVTSWRLNERHYGALVGLSKAGAERIYGKQSLDQWRHGWDTPPPPIDENTRQQWSQLRHCQLMTTFQSKDEDTQILEKEGQVWCGSKAEIPVTESLKDCCDRVLPLFERQLAPHLREGKTILLVAHSNTCKSLLRILDPSVVTETAFSKLRIPNSTPLIYTFRESNCPDHAIPGGLQVVPYKNNQGNDEARYGLRGQWIDGEDFLKDADAAA